MKVAKSLSPWNENSSLPKILTLAPFAVTPPRSGGHQAVLGPNRVLSEKYQILQSCMGMRKENLSFFPRLKILKIKKNLMEFQFLPLAAFGAYLVKGKSGIPPLFASQILSLKTPKYLKLALKDADLIVVEEPWMFRWAHGHRYPHQPIVLIAHNVEGDLLSMILEERSFPFQSMLIRRAREEEAFAFCNADAVIVFSHEDGRRLRTVCGSPRGMVLTIPIGVDAGPFRLLSRQEKESLKGRQGLRGKRVVLFMGSWHPPNREALAAIKVMAGEVRGDACFLILGSVGERAKDAGRIQYRGFVENPEEHLALADLAINPMARGSGVNVKMLHYLAAGLPTITTPVGGRGIRLEHGKTGWIIPLSGFPAAIEDLLNDEGLRSRLGREGRELVEKEYSWEKVAGIRDRLFQELLFKRTPHGKIPQTSPRETLSPAEEESPIFVSRNRVAQQ